jgi:hypothetical protein
LRCDGGCLVLEDLIMGGNSGGGAIRGDVLDGVSSKVQGCITGKLSGSVGETNEGLEGKYSQ